MPEQTPTVAPTNYTSLPPHTVTVSLRMAQDPRPALRRPYPRRAWFPLALTLALLPACAPQLAAGKSRTALAVEPLQRLLIMMRKGDIDAVNTFPVANTTAGTDTDTTSIRAYDPFQTRDLKDLLARSPKLKEALARIAIDPDPPFVEEGQAFLSGQSFEGQPIYFYSGRVIFKLALPDAPAEKFTLTYWIDGPRVTYADSGLSGPRAMLANYRRYIESYPERAKLAAPPAQGNPSASGTSSAPSSTPNLPTASSAIPLAANSAVQPTLPSSAVASAWWPTINAGQTWDVTVGRYAWRVTLTQRVEQAGASSIVGSAVGTTGGAPGAIAAFAIVPSSSAVILALQNDAFSLRCEFSAAQSGGTKLGGMATLRAARSRIDEAFGPCSAALER